MIRFWRSKNKIGKYKLHGDSLLRFGNGLFAENALPPMEPRRICKTGWEYPRLDMKDKKCKKADNAPLCARGTHKQNGRVTSKAVFAKAHN